MSIKLTGLELSLFQTATCLVLSNDAPAIDKAVARVAKAALGDRIGICNGTDDQVEVQAALNAAATPRVQLLDGNFNFSAELLPPSNSVLLGLGQEATIINGAPGIRTIRITDKDDVTVGGFKVVGGENGVMVERTCNRIRLQNIWAHGQNRCLNIVYGEVDAIQDDISILNCRVEASTLEGVLLSGSGILRNLLIQGLIGVNTGAEVIDLNDDIRHAVVTVIRGYDVAVGIGLNNHITTSTNSGYDIVIDDAVFYGDGTSSGFFLFSEGTGTPNKNIILRNATFRNFVVGIYLRGQITGGESAITDISVEGCHVIDCTIGLQIGLNGTELLDYIQIVGNGLQDNTTPFSNLAAAIAHLEMGHNFR